MKYAPLALPILASLSLCACKATLFKGSNSNDSNKQKSSVSPDESDAGRTGTGKGDRSPDELDANGNPIARGPNGEPLTGRPPGGPNGGGGGGAGGTGQYPGGSDQSGAGGPGGSGGPGGAGGSGGSGGSGGAGQYPGSGGQGGSGTGGNGGSGQYPGGGTGQYPGGGTGQYPGGGTGQYPGGGGTGQPGTGTGGSGAGGIGTYPGGPTGTVDPRNPNPEPFPPPGSNGGTTPPPQWQTPQTPSCGPRFQMVTPPGGPTGSVRVDTSYHPITPIFVVRDDPKETVCSIYVRATTPSGDIFLREGASLRYAVGRMELSQGNLTRSCADTARGLVAYAASKPFVLVSPSPMARVATRGAPTAGVCVARKVDSAGNPTADRTYYILIP